MNKLYFFYEWLIINKDMNREKFENLTQQEYFELEREFENCSKTVVDLSKNHTKKSHSAILDMT